MRCLALSALLAMTTIVAAEPGVTASPEAPRHTVYVELLGKAGPYGVGYEHAITGRLSLGIAGSYAVVRDQRIATITPYVHARLLGRVHQLFTEVGAVLVHTRIPSPVPEWDGTSDTGGGGFAALGWQRSWNHVLVRAHGSIVVGEVRPTPWGGLALGWRR